MFIITSELSRKHASPLSTNASNHSTRSPFCPWAPTNKLVEAITHVDLVLLLATLLAPSPLLPLGEARKGDPTARASVHVPGNFSEIADGISKVLVL